MTESVESVAVYVVDSATVSLTVNVATPDAFVVPETVVIVEEPPDFASVTVLPATVFEFESRRVTVMVALALPSATTDAGEALTVDCAAVGTPSVKTTVAVCSTPVDPIVALWVTVWETVFVTVNVAWPDALVTPET